MLPTVLKPNSSSLREAAKTLCSWALKDMNLVCRCRPYHGSKQLTLPFTRDVLLKASRNPIRFTRLSYKTAVKPDSQNDENAQAESVQSEEARESAEDIFKKHNITVKGKNVPPPIFTMEEANFPDDIKEVLKRHDVVTPTPIQSVAWGTVLSGRDLVGISPTGSGKTLAYGVPAVIRVKQLRAEAETSHVPAPLALVLAPTRELAQQIEVVMQWFRHESIRCVAAYGGVKKHLQLQALDRGVDVLVATPGRCYDLLESDVVTLDRCSFLVLDEADRMLDMGFLPQIEPIIERMPTDRQSLMWSATWPKEVREIATKFLSNYVQVNVGSIDLKPCKNVKQNIVMCDGFRDKNKKLIDLLSETLELPDCKVLIFAERKIDVDNLERTLRAQGLRVSTIHGGKGQGTRDGAIARFRRGNVKILVATAVAARGLDIDNVTHVVNFDCPKSSEEYIHKIGRTGRMDKKGESITFVSDHDNFAGYLIDMLHDADQEVPKELYRFEKGYQMPQWGKKRQEFKSWNRNRNTYGRRSRGYQRPQDGWE